MTRRLKAVVTGVAAAGASLFVSIPASVSVAERLSSPENPAQTPVDGLYFQASAVEVNLIPALVFAVVTFVAVFIWTQRRRETPR